MYQQEAIRDSVAESCASDYLKFLRECRIEMQIESVSAANLERVHELTQRTNQMNFSGSRYQRALLEEIRSHPASGHLRHQLPRPVPAATASSDSPLWTPREPRLNYLAFSCRILS